MSDRTPFVDRRDLFAASAAFGAAFLAGSQPPPPTRPRPRPRKKYAMKKSINLWAFPYPEKMTSSSACELAKDAGFDGIELNYDLDSDLSPKSGPKEFAAIRKTAEKIGIAISGLCSFLFWPYPLIEQRPGEAGPRAGAGRQDRRGGRTTWARRTCWSCRGRSTSRGGPTTSRCRTTSATSGRRRRSASCSRWPRS